MSREIEYRAWHKEDKKMLHVCGIDWMVNLEQDCVEISAVNCAERRSDGWVNGGSHDIEDVILMQYTGIKDKNSVKVFEGDIVQQHHFYDTQGVEQFLTHIVEWSDKYSGWFALNADSMDESDGSQQLWAYMKSGYEVRVIGNIHEDNK